MRSLEDQYGQIDEDHHDHDQPYKNGTNGEQNAQGSCPPRVPIEPVDERVFRAIPPCPRGPLNRTEHAPLHMAWRCRIFN